MAVSTSSYFANGVPGQLMVGAEFNLHAEDATPKFAIGTKVELQDGTVARYCHFGAATNRGVLVSQDISESTTADTDNAVIAPASAVAVAGETVKPGAIGSRYFEMTLAGITADQFAGGYAMITDDTGEGYRYRIKGNTATDTPATGNIRVELYEPLVVALDATSDVELVGSMYANLESATSADFACVGVSARSMTSTYFGWVITKGVVNVLTSGTTTAGKVGMLTGTGAVTDLTDSSAQQIGLCLVAGDTTGHTAYKINLE